MPGQVFTITNIVRISIGTRNFAVWSMSPELRGETIGGERAHILFLQGDVDPQQGEKVEGGDKSWQGLKQL